MNSWYDKRFADQPHYLYFATRNIDWPIIKIGITENIPKRMAQLKTRALVVVTDNYYSICALEQELHCEYGHLAVPHLNGIGRTEWFHREDELAADILAYLNWPNYWNWNVGTRIKI
jgi:T5orf172 domain